MGKPLVRSRLLTLFAGIALVTPTTSYLCAQWGWSPAEIGAAISLMTGAAVVFSPMWGILDDKMAGFGMRLASSVSVFSCLLLWISATWTVTDKVSLTVSLILFGASSGGIEPLISAHIQRLDLMGKYPRLRLFGTGGWMLGLGVASVGVLCGTPEIVYLFAALLFGYLLIASYVDTVEASRPGKTQWRLPSSVLLFVFIGIPIPTSAYVYLIFTATTFETLNYSFPNSPFITLVLLAALEIPAFLLVQKIIPGHSLIALYTFSIGLLAFSWVALIVANGNFLLQVAALPAHAAAAALWTSLQVNVVKHYSKPGQTSFSQTSTSAISKCLSAIIAGVGAGWLMETVNSLAVAWLILTLCLFSFLCLLAVFKSSSPIATIKILPTKLVPIER